MGHLPFNLFRAIVRTSTSATSERRNMLSRAGCNCGSWIDIQLMYAFTIKMIFWPFERSLKNFNFLTTFRPKALGLVTLWGVMLTVSMKSSRFVLLIFSVSSLSMCTARGRISISWLRTICACRLTLFPRVGRVSRYTSVSRAAKCKPANPTAAFLWAVSVICSPFTSSITRSLQTFAASIALGFR